MTASEQRALVSIALRAAHADGFNDLSERAALQRAAASFGAAGIDAAAIESDIVNRRTTLAADVAELGTPDARRLAYEIAVAVTGADGARTTVEDTFLAELGAALGLPADVTMGFAAQADAVTAAVPATTGGTPTVTTSAAPDPAVLDRQIVEAAITNAALELLPETLATIAIVPLQMKLVYRIGQAYGYELDAGHAREFLAALGIGLSGQLLEQVGRKLLGGLLGALAGGVGRAVGNQAASSGMAFATTWAIGKLAVQYYAGGRALDTAKLKAAFGSLFDEAKLLATRYAGDIRQRAKTIDVRQLPALLR